MIEQYKSSLEPPYFLSEENQNKQMISATAALLLASSIIAPATTQAKQQKYLQSSQCAYFLQQQAKVSVNNAIPYTAKSCGYMKAWASDFGITVTCGTTLFSGGATVVTKTVDSNTYPDAAIKASVLSVISGTKTLSGIGCVLSPNSSGCIGAQTSIENALRNLAGPYCLNPNVTPSSAWNCDTVTQPVGLTVCAP